MKFYVTRTSEPYNDFPPCEGAIKLEETNMWENPLWGIEINSLEELLALKDKVKYSIIIGKSFDGAQHSDYSIEIYDGYRE